MAGAVEWLGNALSHAQNAITLYGNCYVMFQENGKGITWQRQDKKIAANELSQCVPADKLKDVFLSVSLMYDMLYAVLFSYDVLLLACILLPNTFV